MKLHFFLDVFDKDHNLIKFFPLGEVLPDNLSVIIGSYLALEFNVLFYSKNINVSQNEQK